MTDQAVANPVHAFIADTVKQHDVVLFMKGTPDAPRCGIKTFSDWPTIPQLYIKGEFVGGSDIVREMFNAGELQTLLADKGVPLGDADA